MRKLLYILLALFVICAYMPVGATSSDNTTKDTVKYLRIITDSTKVVTDSSQIL